MENNSGDNQPKQEDWKEKFNQWKKDQFDPFDDDNSNAHKYGAEKARNYLDQFVISPLQQQLQAANNSVNDLIEDNKALQQQLSSLQSDNRQLKSELIKASYANGKFEQQLSEKDKEINRWNDLSKQLPVLLGSTKSLNVLDAVDYISNLKSENKNLQNTIAALQRDLDSARRENHEKC